MNGVLAIIPGIALTTIIGLISLWISDFIGINILGYDKSPISSVMVAILMGILISNIVKISNIFYKGINFAVKKVLKLGIILLGIRLSIMEVLSLGLTGIPIVVICIIGGITVAVLFAKWMNLSKNLGLLIGVGTSICGVSAIVATGPSINAKKEEITYAIAVITVFGIFATIFYPYMVNLLFAGDPVKAGLFLGTSIHDTSQVTGAGLLYAEVFNQQITLDVAIVTKLVRNVFMVVMIPLMSFLAKKTNYDESIEAESKHLSIIKNIDRYFPTFIMGFILLAILRSVGDFTVASTGKAYGLLQQEYWEVVYNLIKKWAVIFLVIALAGVGLNTKFTELKSLGIKPFIVGFITATVVGVISYVSIIIFGETLTL